MLSTAAAPLHWYYHETGLCIGYSIVHTTTNDIINTRDDCLQCALLYEYALCLCGLLMCGVIVCHISNPHERD